MQHGPDLSQLFGETAHPPPRYDEEAVKKAIAAAGVATVLLLALAAPVWAADGSPRPTCGSGIELADCYDDCTGRYVCGNTGAITADCNERNNYCGMAITIQPSPAKPIQDGIAGLAQAEHDAAITDFADETVTGDVDGQAFDLSVEEEDDDQDVYEPEIIASCSARSKRICAAGCRARPMPPGARYLFDVECHIDYDPQTGTATRNCKCMYMGIMALRNFR
jgi:hypothetical protein